MMADNNARIEKDFGTISTKINHRTAEITEVKLTKTSWFNRPAKWELRNWVGNTGKSGVVIGGIKHLKLLRDMLTDLINQIEAEDAEDDDD